MYGHTEPSEGFPMVDLASSSKEVVFPDTSWDEEIAQKLFGDLNRGLLGPPGDNHVILLSKSKEEEEMREDDHTNAEVVLSSIGNSPASTAFTANDDDAPEEVQDDSSGGGTPDWVSVCLRMPRQKGCLQERALKNLRITMILYCCTINSLAKKNEDGGAE
jgi:hypothetical protein